MSRPTLRLGNGFDGDSPHLREDVRELQNQLTRRAYRIGPADGLFGNVTDAAVKHFQRNRGLEETGVVGPQEWSALLDEPATPVGSTFTPPGSSSAEPARIADVPDTPEWLRIAKGEAGQIEIAGNNANNPRIVEYHATTQLASTPDGGRDETPWCASFLNWVFRQMGITGTGTAWALHWAEWGVATTAQTGAVAVIYSAQADASTTASGNHCAFLVAETDSHFVLLGGNQDNQVKVKDFPKSKWELIAYRWPQGY